MRIIGTLITIAILFSYAPAMPMNGCVEENYGEGKETDCGDAFHCPGIPALPTASPFIPSLAGQLRSTIPKGKFEEFTRAIFHPPEGITQIVT